MLSLLSGTVGKVAMYVTLATTLAGSVGLYLHERDNRIIAEVAAKEAVINLATQQADAKRTIDELQAKAKIDVAEASKRATIKGAIASAKPSSVSCIRSDAGRVVLNGLRSDSGSHASATH